jgi:large repetitive protein
VITWSAPDSRGDAITSYSVEIEGATSGAWSAETTHCTGNPTATTCTVPMSVLTAAPYSLTQGALVAARVTATNSYGPGQASSANTVGADVRVAPLAMAAPTRGPGTAISQVEVLWTVLSAPNNGGSAVTSYHLQWDQGTGTWADLVGLVSPYVQTSYTVTTGVTTGTSFSFKVRAKNVYGWGPYSDSTSIIASQAPAQPQVPTTEIVGTDAEISWTAPADNGEAITAYEVLVLESDGTTFTEESTSCDGSDSAVVAALSCTIPLATLRASPYSLTLGELVRVKVRAINGQGPGPFS